MVFNSVLNNFTSGEWSPKMLARTDTDQYPRAAREITNGFVRPQGGVFSRPGTVLAESLTTSIPGGHAMIPYYFRGQRFCIILGAIFTPPNQFDPFYYAFTDSFTVTTVNSTLSLSPEATQSLGKVRYVQVGETLFCVAPNTPPFVITYNLGTGALDVTPYIGNTAAGPTSSYSSIPYGPVNADNIKGTLTVTGTLTAGGAVTITSTQDLFFSNHAESATNTGLRIKITSGGNSATIRVTGYTNSKTVTGVMLTAKTGASPLTVGSASGTAFELSSWNTHDGWPTCITAIQNRLVFGRGSELFFTRAGNYFNLMEIPFQQDAGYTAYPSDGARAFTAAPFSTGVTKIMELTASKTLVILTENSEIVGYGGSNGISALPGGFIVESSSSFGSARVAPVRINNFVTYSQMTADTVRDLTFSWEQSQYKSMDLTFPAEHLFRGELIRNMDASEQYGSHLWVRTQSGKLFHCSLDRDYNITAWSRIVINGYFVESICVLKANELYSKDTVIMVLGKEGSADNVIVRMVDGFYLSDNIIGHDDVLIATDLTVFREDPDSDPINVIPNLAVFEGKEVQVIADGFYLGKFTVTGGSITLPNKYLEFQVGIPRNFRLESMPVEAGARLGDAAGKTKRIDTVFVRFHQTLGARYGCPQTNEYYQIPFRLDSQPMNQPSTVRDLDVELSFPGTYSKVATVAVESDFPFPCNVLGIGIQGLTNE